MIRKRVTTRDRGDTVPVGGVKKRNLIEKRVFKTSLKPKAKMELPNGAKMKKKTSPSAIRIYGLPFKSIKTPIVPKRNNKAPTSDDIVRIYFMSPTIKLSHRQP